MPKILAGLLLVTLWFGTAISGFSIATAGERAPTCNQNQSASVALCNTPGVHLAELK
jgi:hypothetical protein